MTDQRPLKKPIDWDELYPGRFLKAGQLPEGRHHTLTIQDVIVDRLPDSKTGADKVKGVITFAEVPYQLALNKTNGICLKAMFGRVLDKWTGRKVTIFRGTVESGSQRGEPAVRVWGSPELPENLVVEIQHPRKRAFKMTLHRVQLRGGDRPQSVERHPTEGQAPPESASAGRDPNGGERPPY